MKIYMKPIRMLSVTETDGRIRPFRFQLEHRGEKITVKVDRINQQSQEKLAGIPSLIFRCQSVIHNIERVYELKYEISTHKWFLYKM
ncbi:MAG: hypothetical protein ACOX22_12670 [Caldicoprobacterales bacterium]|jgi:hypothetical protein